MLNCAIGRAKRDSRVRFAYPGFAGDEGLGRTPHKRGRSKRRPGRVSYWRPPPEGRFSGR